MKQIIIIASILLLSNATVKAQQDGISFGIKAGINWSGLKGRDVDSFSSGGPARQKAGWTVGITLNNKMSRHFWLKHEIYYSRRLTTVQIDDDVHPPFSSQFTRGYIDLFPATPVFHYKGFQVYAGPYLGTLVSASVQRKDANGNLYTDKSLFGHAETSSEYSQKFDAGIVAGIEYELPIGINLGARFVRGFVPLIEDPGTQHQWRIHNQGITLTIGYTILK